MRREDNLIPFSERTEEDQRRIRSAGGKKSGEVRRKKRDAKQAAKLILNLPVELDAVKANLKKLGVDSDDMTNMVALMARMFTKGMEGDDKAARLLLEMSGDTPRQKNEDARLKMDKEKHRREMEIMSDNSTSTEEAEDLVIYIPDNGRDS